MIKMYEGFFFTGVRLFKNRFLFFAELFVAFAFFLSRFFLSSLFCLFVCLAFVRSFRWMVFVIAPFLGLEAHTTNLLNDSV